LILDIGPGAAHTAVMSPDLDPVTLIERLRDDLGHRRIEHAVDTLDRIRPTFAALGPRPGCGILVGLIAQWVDAGFDEPALLRCLLEKFPKESRASLPVADYLHLRMAEAVIAMDGEDFETALQCLQLVRSFEDEVNDPELMAIANFWLARCYRRMGRYGEALQYTEHGESMALACGYPQMAAIMQVTRSWLAFQKGKLQEATALLRQAEAALNPTSDYLNRGHIQSAYGRIARRQGKYDRALESFERAIEEYRSSGAAHLQLARTLLNLAFVKRLIALELQRGLDRAATSRRGAGGPSDNVREQRAHIEELRRSATAHLDEAYHTYQQHQNQRGVAGVHINRGFLYLDEGDLEGAASEAAEAFLHGAEKADAIVMARARTLQCIVENTAMDEQVGDCAHHREAAETFAREAVTFAGQTENRRLLARAYVWQGLTFTADPADLEAARRCCEQATALLQPEGLERQYTWDDLETLKTRVMRSRPVESVLQAWSAGIVENTTFQQMTEEFARIVIPQVWEREGRKISKVAEKLSISPKKVRRILHAAGATDKGEKTDPAADEQE
jgi:tetratricopeptide (TPR) repeat protein